MTQYQAIGRGSLQGPISPTPRAAAEAFFMRYPTRKLCHVVEGEQWGDMLRTKPLVHKFWLHVYRDQVDLLPELTLEVTP